MDEYSDQFTDTLSKMAYIILCSQPHNQTEASSAFQLFLPGLLHAQEETSLPEPLVAAFLLYACGHDAQEEALRQFYDYTGHEDDVDVEETDKWFNKLLDLEDAISDGSLADQPFEVQMIYVGLQKQYYLNNLNDLSPHNQQYYKNFDEAINLTLDLMETLDEDVAVSGPAKETLALIRENLYFVKGTYDNSSLKKVFNKIDKIDNTLDADFSIDAGPSTERIEQLEQLLGGEISNAAWDTVQNYARIDDDVLFEDVVPALHRLDETEGAPEVLVAAALLFRVAPEERTKAITDFCQLFYEEDPEAVNETLTYCEKLESLRKAVERADLSGEPSIMQLYYIAQQDIYLEQKLEEKQMTKHESVLRRMEKDLKIDDSLNEDVLLSKLFYEKRKKMSMYIDFSQKYNEVKQTTERLKGDFKNYKNNNGKSKDGFTF